MKKITTLTLIFSLLIFSACSSDDDSTAENLDPIIGKWFVEAMEADGEYVEANECESNSFMDFNANGSFTMVSFMDYNGSCEGELMEEFTQWENIGNNQYKFIGDEGINPILEITFSEDGNRFTTDNGNNVHYYYVKE